MLSFPLLDCLCLCVLGPELCVYVNTQLTVVAVDPFLDCRNTAERHAAAPHAAVRGGNAGGLAAGDASRATGTSVATVTTSLAAVELCDEDVAMRCSAQSDAGSAADPEWEAVLAQLLAEEAEEEELCCRFERRWRRLRRRVGQLQ